MDYYFLKQDGNRFKIKGDYKQAGVLSMVISSEFRMGSILSMRNWDQRTISDVSTNNVQHLSSSILVPFRPYFYIQSRAGLEYELSRFVSRRFERMGTSMKVDIIEKEDLELLNHLSGLRGKFIRLSFDHEDEMKTILKPIREATNRNKKLRKQNQGGFILDGLRS